MSKSRKLLLVATILIILACYGFAFYAIITHTDIPKKTGKKTEIPEKTEEKAEGIKLYKYNGHTYMVPLKREQEFVSRYEGAEDMIATGAIILPDVPAEKTEEKAEGIKLYKYNGHTYMVPLKREQEFVSKREGAEDMTTTGAIILLSSSDDPEKQTDKTDRQSQSVTPPATKYKPKPVPQIKTASPVDDAPMSTDIRLTTGDNPYNTYFGKGMRDSESLSKITVQNGTNQDAVAIFINVHTGKCMRNVYVKAHSNYTIKQIPEGTYKMKCYYGNDWDYSLNNGAGFPTGGFKRNVYFTTPSSSKYYFDINREETYEGYSYATYTVTLHKVTNGNMQTKGISKNDFFN